MTTSVLDSRELRALSLFARWNPDDLAAVAAPVTETVALPEGTIICRECGTASQWWIVAEGTYLVRSLRCPGSNECPELWILAAAGNGNTGAHG